MCRRDAVYTQVSHVVSIVVLALRLNATKSAVGISLKTQELYLIVFVARYADLFSHFYSLYNTFMKVAFMGASMCGHAECVRVLLSAGAGSGINDRNPINKTALDCAIRYGPRNGRRRVFPLLLAAGATIPSDTTDAYLCKVRAVGFPAYEKAHRQALATKFAAKVFPRLPTDVAGHVVAFAFHVGYY